jgi:hypothetical protein
MRNMSRNATALAALVAMLLVPVLPPEHLHRGAVGAHHGLPLVHRHFAGHTSPNGTHVGDRGVAEGAPVWLADPSGWLPDSIPLHTGVAVGRLHRWPPQSSGSIIRVAPGLTLSDRPHTPFGLRAPPVHL